MSDEPLNQGNNNFTLFINEERVLDDADQMIRSLESVGEGVQALAKAYRRSYNEQRRLLRLSDRAQADLQNANQRLSEKTEELQALNNQLREANEQKDLLLSIIGHDLRNPFSIVNGYTRYLSQHGERLPPETVKDMAGRAFDASSAVSRLLDTLLEWGRVQNGQVTCDLKSLRIVELLAETVSLYESVAERKGIALEVTGDPDLLAIADADMTATILRNLVNNALKFTGEGGRVMLGAVRAGRDDGWVAITVSDTGSGIPEDRLSELFTPNTNKAVAGTNGERGLGLGLPICKRLAEYQGASLEVRTEAGAGSCFMLSVPRD